MERTKLNLPDVINHSPKVAYTKVPNSLINDPDISPVAFKVYCILISNPEGWRTYKKNLYDRMACGVTSINNALKELQDKKGLLVRVTVRDSKTKRRRGSFLAITDTPFQFEFTKDRIHPSLMNKGLELYYKSYIIESHIIESYIIEINTYIKTIYKKEKKEKDVSSPAAEKNGYIIPSQFEDFWKLYPRKVDKGKCFSKWKTICGRQSNRPTWRQIKKAILQQQKSERWQDTTFIPHPTTWLNQSRWMDDPNEMNIPKLFKNTPPNTVGSRVTSEYKKIKYREPDLIID